MESDRVRAYPLLVEPLRMLPLVLISLFVAVGAVDLLLAVQPAILHTLRAYWHGAAGGGTASSALAAASLIVGGVALAATLLAAFIRGVRSAPYLCITPVWVCTCMLAIARLPIELPLPVPMSAFVAVSALLFVGSGVLFETTARLPNLIGTAASLLPLTLLSIGYALHPQARASGDTILMFCVLALAAAGAPAIAIACRGASSRALTDQPSDGREPTRTHIVELLERVRLSEERAESAERQLASVPSWQPVAAPRLAVGDEDAALLRSRGPGGVYGWAAAGIVLAIAMGGYLFVHAPLRAQLATQARLAQEHIDKQTAALGALRADFARQRADLEQQLAAAPPAAVPAASPAPSERPARTVKTVATPHESDSADASAEREAQAQARVARREEAAAARAERAAEREAGATAAREARETERAARAEEREARAAERATRASEKPARKGAPVADADSEEEADAPSDAAEAKRAAAPPEPAAKPNTALDSDDPLEGLDQM